MLLKCMKFEIGQGFIRLEMNIWIVIFLSLLVHLKNADGVNASSEGKLKVRPLPKGKSYSLSKEEAKLEWNLRGLSDIADGIALALRKDPPYGNLTHFCLFFSLHVFYSIKLSFNWKLKLGVKKNKNKNN